MVEVCSAWLLDHSMRSTTARKDGVAVPRMWLRMQGAPPFRGPLHPVRGRLELDEPKEGHPSVYHQTPVQVITVQGEAVEAITYVVQPAATAL